MNDYLYSDTNQKHDIFLHDCFCNAITLQKNTLIFHFAEGFFLGKDHALNSLDTLAYTGESEMRIQLVYTDPDVNVTIYLMKETENGTCRQEIPLKEFMKQICQEKQLEFLYTYQGIDTDSVLFRCELHFDKHPFRRECVLLISAKEISYCWNELFPEGRTS